MSIQQCGSLCAEKHGADSASSVGVLSAQALCDKREEGGLKESEPRGRLWYSWVFFEDWSHGDGVTPGAATTPPTSACNLDTRERTGMCYCYVCRAWRLQRGITSPKPRA